jgi:hypothetical protein
VRNPSVGSRLFKSDEKGQLQDCGEFKAERGNTTVTALLEDHEGAVWIGTSFSGLLQDGPGLVVTMNKNAALASII